MAKKSKGAPEEEEEERRPEAVVNAYRDRLKSLRQAQEYSNKGDIPKSVERYSHYLNSLAAYMKVKEGELSPKMFDPEKDLTEMLLISNSYWDLAKAYDRSPNLQMESIRCLNQFVKFTSGYKYQHVNAQMVKKFLQKRRAHNARAFQEAYDRLRIDAKSCFIATYAFGEESLEVQYLRLFREKIANYRPGLLFIDFYYRFSPTLVAMAKKLPFEKSFRHFLVRPAIRGIIALTKRF